MSCEEYESVKAAFGCVMYLLYFTVMPAVGVWAWNALRPFFAQAGVVLPVMHYKEMWLLMLLAMLLFH